MALGDAAAAKNMEVVAPNAKVGLGDDEINRTRDYIAAEIDARTTADAAKLDKTMIIVSTTDPASSGTVPEGALWFKAL
jgi:hypothetical protein